MVIAHTYVNLFSHLSKYRKEQFTGYLQIRASSGLQWYIYFCLGRIVWARSSYTLRRLRRYLAYYCPQIHFKNLVLVTGDRNSNCWDYDLLNFLLRCKQLTKEQVGKIIEKTISEVLFDLLQQGDRESLTYDLYPQDLLGVLKVLLLPRIEIILPQVYKKYEAWVRAGLSCIYPDSAPIIRDPQNLQTKISPKTYKKLLKIANGKYTLRELSCLLKRQELRLSRSLFPYIYQGFIQLITVSDIHHPSFGSKTFSPYQSRKYPKSTIACVDDNVKTCSLMRQILSSAGYNFTAIVDPIYAIVKLLEAKPDLIFLDLVMPVANGYEICSQLRRTQAFSKTPIVILTGNDGVIDRMRAKVVGASNFLTKPIEKCKILELTRQILEPATS